MALKRKQHEEQEEQRRQMVLEQRRRQMIDVTNKFQRLGRRQTCNNNNNNNNAAGPQLHYVNNMSLCLFTFHIYSLELLTVLALSVEQSRLLLELLPTVLSVRPGPT